MSVRDVPVVGAGMAPKRVEPRRDGATRLTLGHTGLADEDDVMSHREGWERSLDRLAALP